MKPHISNQPGMRYSISILFFIALLLIPGKYSRADKNQPECRAPATVISLTSRYHLIKRSHHLE